MKLEAKSRLQATPIRNLGPIPQSAMRMPQSVRQFFTDIANKTAKVTPLTGDCRSIVAKALQLDEHRQSEIVIVGLAPGHALHAFTTNAEGEPIADAYVHKQYDPKTGIYKRTRDGQVEDLDTLYRMPVHEFMTQWVAPRTDLPDADARIDAYVAAHQRTSK